MPPLSDKSSDLSELENLVKCLKRTFTPQPGLERPVDGVGVAGAGQRLEGATALRSVLGVRTQPRPES